MDYLETAVIYVTILLAISVLPYMIVKHNYVSLKFITVVTIVQNFVCILASNVCTVEVVQLLILYKEMVFYGTVFYVIIEKKKISIKKVLFPLLSFIIMMFVYMTVNSTNLYAKLICFRQLMTPFILVLYGNTISISQENVRRYIKFVINWGFFIAIFGIFERFIWGDRFWLQINIRRYYDIRGFSSWVFRDLPGNYYSADFYSLIGISIRRLAGFLCDPLLTGHYLAFCFAFLLFINVYSKRYIQNIVLIIIGFAIFATLSKGAILILCISVVVKIYRMNKRIGEGLILIMALMAVFIIRHGVFDSVARHIGGLISSLTFELMLGGGIGSAGNYAKLYGGQSATTGESYMGLVIGQMGILSALLFIYVFYKICRHILRYNKESYVYAIVAYIIGVIFEAFMSESAINFVGSGIVFILLGVLITSKISKDNESIHQMVQITHIKN